MKADKVSQKNLIHCKKTTSDDGMSNQVSNLWFGDKHQSTTTDADDEEEDKKITITQRRNTSTRTVILTGLLKSLNEHKNDSKATGKEISSSIASAAKINWHKPQKKEIF